MWVCGLCDAEYDNHPDLKRHINTVHVAELKAWERLCRTYKEIMSAARETERSCFTCESGTKIGALDCEKCLDMRDDVMLAGWKKRKKWAHPECVIGVEIDHGD